MTALALDALRQVALPPLALALRMRHLEERRSDPAAVDVADGELTIARRIRTRQARQGWWNG
jgi:hypothetical protein